MQVLELRDVDDYVERLRTDHEEVIRLFDDLLIGVTAFFRDKDAFEALAERVIPPLFEGKGATDQIRVWVPGCATGEEAYSIAILLFEHIATLESRPKFAVFATDIDDPAIATRASRAIRRRCCRMSAQSGSAVFLPETATAIPSARRCAIAASSPRTA
jgi:two-component system CheB/CheR fusion protein